MNLVLSFMIAEGEIKVIMLCGTLKRSNQFSHTRTMCEFLEKHFETHDCKCEIVDLVEYNLKPGVESDEGEGDEWPEVLKKVLAADILIFATPIWWGTYSSLIQRVIERMDALNDELLETGKSELANKIGGMVISGAEDGAEHIIGQIAGFFSWNGLTVPPAPSLSYLGNYPKNKEELMEQLEKSKPIKNMAEVMSYNLNYFARLLKSHPMPEVSKGTSKDIPPGTVGMKG
ncbi:NAD(P)H-dependent oxidoreductase [Candidatus Parcubacteria bacterium]|nr:NAD(P)H-dependent oxidoreductase [Candidatus Parcubacteria bacterium]